MSDTKGTTRSEALKIRNAEVLSNGRCVGHTEWDEAHGTVLVMDWHAEMCEHKTLSVEAVTDRPWNGPSAITGKTVEDYRRELGEFPPQAGGEFPAWLTRAAVAICRSYGIKGSCDPAYIANVINNERVGFKS